MTAVPYDRTLLNDWLRDQLGTADLPVSLAAAPPGAGWLDAQGREAQPNTPGASFAAYATLTPGTGVQNQRNPLGDDASSWVQPYTLMAVGGVAEQAEAFAAVLRRRSAGVSRVKLDLDGPWGVLRVEVKALGGLVRNDATNPPLWTVSDTLNLWLERARSLA